MADQWKSPDTEDDVTLPADSDEVRGRADESDDEEFEDDGDLDDEEDDEESGTF
jgi:hypothetical protein